MTPHNIYSAIQIASWQLGAVVFCLMLQKRWYRLYTLLFCIQAMQLAELNLGLYWWLTHSPHYTPFRENIFWPNMVLEALVIGYCVREYLHHNHELNTFGIVTFLHMQARYVHYSTYDIHPTLRWEYALMEFGTLAILATLIVTILRARIPSAGEQNERYTAQAITEAHPSPER